LLPGEALPAAALPGLVDQATAAEHLESVAQQAAAGNWS
jgi:hypothetical protein